MLPVWDGRKCNHVKIDNSSDIIIADYNYNFFFCRMGTFAPLTCSVCVGLSITLVELHQLTTSLCHPS